MGCGQSKIGNIYSRNKKNKNNNSKKNTDSIGSASIDQKNGSGKNRSNNNGVEINRNEAQNGIETKNQKKKSSGPGNGPLLHQAEISSSQLDFFRMLDEKIENGPDYDENVDATLRAQRISDLLRRWELANISWSSVADLNQTPNATTAATLTSTEAPKGAADSHSLSAKDRESMRNIIGGRPESAPIFTLNVNRADGLEDIHCPSAKMPKHVLESISQSPTQTLKNSSSSSSVGHRFHVYRVYDNADNANQMMHNNHQNQTTNTNDDFVKQQAIYREQYLQQTGIISVQPQYSNHNALTTNSYVQQFPIATNEEHFSERKGNLNCIQLT